MFEIKSVRKISCWNENANRNHDEEEGIGFFFMSMQKGTEGVMEVMFKGYGEFLCKTVLIFWPF